MRRFLCFWWECLVNARRGSAAFANDWQWLVGFPTLAALLWFFRAYLSSDTAQLLSGATAFGTLMAALIAFFLTMLACFIIRLFIEPPKLFYREKDRADATERELQRRFTPQITVFLDPDHHGVTEIPTEIQAAPPQIQVFPPLRGPSSKWVQFSVSCATDAPLVDCEAWLTSVRRVDGDTIGPQLVEEHIHCHWSQREERKITLPPLLIQRANLFSLYENSQPLPIVPHTNPIKIRLRNAIQQPGSYRVEVLVTAQGAPSFHASFTFEWRNFANVILTQSAN
jgi:hypothetical protein